MSDKKDVSWSTANLISKLTAALKPTEPLSVSEWAEKYMVLPKGSNEAGRYSTDTAKYQKAILDAMSDPTVVRVTVMSSAQVGKTLMLKCGIGYYVDHDPSTQLMVLPTYDLGEKFSKTSLAPMISDVARLSEKIGKARSRDSNNTVINKSYPGGDLVIAGANSPSSLAALPRRIVWMDEVDRFPDSAGSEGNPVLLAEKRTTSYWNRKIIQTSTPTIKGKSRIEDSYLDGTQEEWNVACPECGEYQPYDWDRINLNTAEMACCKCGCLSGETLWKKQKHKWIAEHPERTRHKSYHLNEMASPWSNWEDMVETFQKAMKRKEKYHDYENIKVFYNTALGKTWDSAEMEDTIDESAIQNRAEVYEAELPDGVTLLTASVDVQKNRFEVEIRGWKRGYETWGIEKKKIFGNLAMPEPWEELERFVSRSFEFADGRKLNVACVAIDSGYNTNEVYKWSKAMNRKGKKCYAIKGYAQKEGIPLVYKRTAADITAEGKNGKKIVVDHTVLYVLGVDAGKEDIMNRLAITEKGDGYCHFPANAGRGYDEQYYKGLTSEYKVEKLVRGKYKEVWVKKEGILRNEPLDLFNYNYAALEILRPNWETLEKKVAAGINYMQPASQKQEEASPKKKRNSGDMNIW